jgi:hypothetical protein
MEGLDGFLDWHVGRTRRKTGRAPAASTLATFGYRVRQAAAVAGVDTLPELAKHLEQTELAESILDKLAVTNSTGSLRHTWGACSHFAEYATIQGWMTWPFAMGDRPPMNPQKPIEVYTARQVDLLVEGARVTSLR